MPDARTHWQEVYQRSEDTSVSWYQETPALSIELVTWAAPDPASRILDVGGGHSRLVDGLLARAYRHLGVLDIAPAALAMSQERVGAAADEVEWYAGDVTHFSSAHPWDLWHDRAVFHFLVDAEARDRYLSVLSATVAASGHAVLATFAPTGPERCSGLPVERYDVEALRDVLGGGWTLCRSETEEHHTPSGAGQDFVYAVFQRV